MRETLELISVVDALKSEDECFVCALIEESEKRSLEAYLDDEHVMDPKHHATLRCNHLCKHHLYKLLGLQDRLGFALTLRTLYQSAEEQLERVLEGLREFREADSPGRGLLNELTYALDALVREMEGDSFEDQLSSLLGQGVCPLCSANNDILRRTASIIGNEYPKNDKFKELLRNSCGLCLPHLKSFLEVLRSELPHRQFVLIAGDILDVTRELYRDRGERLEWFIQKFDHTHRNDSWKDSEQAPDKALRRLMGSREVR